MTLGVRPDAVRELSDGTVEVELPPEDGSVAIAQEYVRHRCRDLDEEVLEDVTLIVSELVTNAVRHGRPDIALRFRSDPSAVDVAVIDHGAGEPIRRSPKEVAGLGYGRGLMVVDRLAAAWGFDPLDDDAGKIVWASVDCGKLSTPVDKSVCPNRT